MTRRRDDIDAELDAHIQLAIDDLVRSGVPPEEARRRAHSAFGGLTQTAERCREARGLPFMETTMQDLRYTLRMLRKGCCRARSSSCC